MLSVSSWPDANWRDPEIRLAVKTSSGADWTNRGVTRTLGSELDDNDGVALPVFLPGNRSILYAFQSQTHHARRCSDEVGDMGFSPLGPIDLEGGAPLQAASLSCDGWHLLYVTNDNKVKLVEILSVEPLTFGATVAAGLPDPSSAFSINELYDCSVLYVGTFYAGATYAQRVPCP
jgi:hypothetical protein